MKLIIFNVCLLIACNLVAGQRITTIQLDGVQYFVSRMNPYSPELNYFLAYQYCRSLGLQLASFESKEKAESMSQYLQNAGYSKYDFWTSGNRLGTGMFLWMSTGLPFNATFEYFEDSNVLSSALDPLDHNSNTSPQRTARDSGSGLEKGCVILKAPSLKWAPEDCSTVKDFICEQTRCYYYNYGSIPVSSAQGRPITTSAPTQTTVELSTTTQLPPSPTLAYKEPILLSSFKRIGLPTKDLIQKVHEEEKEEEIEENVEESHEVKSESDEEHDESVEEEQPLEKRLKQISEEVGKFNNNENEQRQSFFSLSDLIKTLKTDKKKPQIDSDYSNTMRVLGETSNDEDGRNFKDISDNKTVEIKS